MARSFSLLSIIFLFIPIVVFARDIEITVEDKDLEMPLEGAVITLRDRQQFRCDANGRAIVSLPDDRPTVITVSYPGYDPLRLSIPAISAGGNVDKFTASLSLGGVMQSQELVIEAARPDTSETRSGRSVAISDRELTRTSEIGIVEDVMNSVKLLPGVGYSGMFSAMPSIRGGDPGDLTAVLDGFYVETPYHWMGSISIFDPKMVTSARLSHGVFSARYGHTISGLLEITSKSPSSTETEYEAAIGSSAASLNLSIPLNKKGGILFMGKITYWETLIWAAKQLSKVSDDENLALVNSISKAPYIGSAAIAANYRFTPNLEWRLNGFFGIDGIGMEVNTDYSRFMDEGLEGYMEMKAKYENMQGFLITGLTASPAPKWALKFTGGIGFTKIVTDDYVNNQISAAYNEDFLNLSPLIRYFVGDETHYSAPNVNADVILDRTLFNVQGRADADIDLGNGFIAAFGVQELYSSWKSYQNVGLDLIEMNVAEIKEAIDNGLYIDRIDPIYISLIKAIPNIPNLAIITPNRYDSNIMNHGLTTSAYGLLEYTSPNQRFGTELGLRMDHLFFKGKDFSFQTKPVLNPRLNIDFGIIKNKDNIDSFTATVGTGLFSSINPLLCFIDLEMLGLTSDVIDPDIDVKFNRSWTSIVGFKVDFLKKYSINLEGYYKYVFDRGYITAEIIPFEGIVPEFHFDGIGHIAGFDVQLQKLESRFWDGWISYTFTWAKYKDPSAVSGGDGVGVGEPEWYFPSFHRFHNANIVLNIKPLNWLHIGIRFGFASGQQRDKVSNEIVPYPVLVVDRDILDEDLENWEEAITIVQKYRRKRLPQEEQGMERRAWTLPLDIKFSFFPVNRYGRASMEIYLAGENLLSLLPDEVFGRDSRITFNSYTGKEEQEASSANFDIPIPLVSFGVKWRY
jgi:hypothetical protein